MKLYIISNRLPVKAVAEKDTFVFSRSEGGLTTGLIPYRAITRNIGWGGPESVQTKRKKNRISVTGWRK